MLQDIEKELGLTREKLIRMALLLGSDYTEGVRCGNYFPYLFWCISVARHAFLSTWRYSNVSFLYQLVIRYFPYVLSLHLWQDISFMLMYMLHANLTRHVMR